MKRDLVDEHGEPAFPSFYERRTESRRGPTPDPGSEFPLGTILLVGVILVGIYYGGTFAYHALISKRPTALDFHQLSVLPVGKSFEISGQVTVEGEPEEERRVEFALDGEPVGSYVSEGRRIFSDGGYVEIRFTPRSVGPHVLTAHTDSTLTTSAAEASLHFTAIGPPRGEVSNLSVGEISLELVGQRLSWNATGFDDPLYPLGWFQVYLGYYGHLNPSQRVEPGNLTTVARGYPGIFGYYVVCAENRAGQGDCT